MRNPSTDDGAFDVIRFRKRDSVLGRAATRGSRARPPVANRLFRYIAAIINAQPRVRALLIRELNRVPGVKRRLKVILSQASLQAAMEASGRRRRGSDVTELSVSVARVLGDLERERARLAAGQADNSR
jgi:hypothetical protein